jgi:poly(3-hydroxybutyrate) depolymerase
LLKIQETAGTTAVQSSAEDKKTQTIQFNHFILDSLCSTTSISIPEFITIMKLLLLNLVLSLLPAAAVGAAVTNNPQCDTGPDSITELGLGEVPQVCVQATGQQGGERCFYIYVPSCAGEDSPLVFDIHGLGSCPLFNVYYTGWMQKANENCFVLLMPLGTVDPEISDSTCFSAPGGMPLEDGSAVADDCCCNKDLKLTDPDVTNDADLMRLFAKTATEQIPVVTEGKVTIDTKRIYMAGHSNGCAESLSVAALHSDMVAAVCCHAGTAVTNFALDYSAVPIWMVSGEKDTDWTSNPFVTTLTAAEVYSSYADKNGCDVTETVTSIAGGSVKTRSNCSNGANVTAVSLTESGHRPYIEVNETSEGASMTTLDTTAMAWEFCSSFSKPVAPVLTGANIDYLTFSPKVTPVTSAAVPNKRAVAAIQIVSSIIAVSFVLM